MGSIAEELTGRVRAAADYLHPDGLHVQLRIGATVVATFPYLWGAAQYKEYLDHSTGGEVR